MSNLPAWTKQVHHDGSEAFVSNNLPMFGDTVTISLQTPAHADLNHVYIRAMNDGEFHWIPMQVSAETSLTKIWSADMTIVQPRTDYVFKLMTDDGSFYYTARGVSRADAPDHDAFCILAEYDAPLWVREQVFYQIFPERFYNGDPSNDVQDGEYVRKGHATIQREWGDSPYPWGKAGSVDFFGGDLQGITQKLDYLQELGVTAIYLCPIFEALSNHKYDIIDYHNVDPHFGGNQALAELRAETEKRGIKIMLDVTTNHCGYAHPWFKAVEEDPNADTAEFFYRDLESGNFEYWLGVPSLIKLNYNSERLRDVMYRDEDSALRQWLQPPYSIDGWRMDVANMTGNRAMGQLDHDVWQEMRGYLKQDNPAAYLLGEYFQDSTPHIQGNELDASMNYQGFNTPMRRWLGAADLAHHDHHPYSDTNLLPTEALAEQWERFMAATPYPIVLQQFNQLDSHDTTRILDVVNGDAELMRMALALLIGFPGVPCIYYATEIHMEGGKDPDNRRTMRWDESTWDQDLLAYTKKLIALRRESHTLTHGGFKVLHAEGDLVAFARLSAEDVVLVVGYRGKDMLPHASIDVTAIGLEDGTQVEDALGGATFTIREGALSLQNLAHGAAMISQVSKS
jgi:alpha-glucosidase